MVELPDDDRFDVCDDDVDDGFDDADDCGRWLNGRLSDQCSRAGSEECDWVCPIGLDRKTWP